MLLHEAGSYVGEVVKAMGKTKVLVKVRVVISSPLRLEDDPSPHQEPMRIDC